MKTIKELTKKFIAKEYTYFWLGYEKSLKDVLELIDEIKYEDGDISTEELKSRITGDKLR